MPARRLLPMRHNGRAGNWEIVIGARFELVPCVVGVQAWSRARVVVRGRGTAHKVIKWGCGNRHGSGGVISLIV